MKKLRMLFLLGGTLLLGVTPLAAQNSVDVLDGGPQPTDKPMPAIWSSTSNASPTPMDITSPIAQYFVYAGTADTPAMVPAAVSGHICLVQAGGLTGVYSVQANSCRAQGAIAVLIFNTASGAINSPSPIPVFAMSNADGLFLRDTVGSDTVTLLSKYRIRINVAPVPANPTGQHNCPSSQAATAYVGPGITNFTPSESLCLPAGAGQGVEPSMIVDSQGTIYVESIRGVPAGLDLWRWDQSRGPNTPDGGPNADGTLPFKYEGQPDGCGIFPANTFCSTAGVAPGGGDGDVATNAPDLTNHNIPNLGVVSLSAAEVTASHSTDRADTFSGVTNAVPLNPAASHFPGDDRMWIDAYDDASTVYMNYHDLATGFIHVQRSTDGGANYNAGTGEAIDTNTIGAANAAGSGNVAGQIKIDKNTNSCPSRGNLYQIFSAPDSMAENTPCTGSPLVCAPLRTVYVGVSTDAKSGAATFNFTDYKIFTSPTGSLGATNGTAQVFPALATDNNGFVYAVWSDNTNIYFASSVGPSQGSVWNPAKVVNQGSTVRNANVFPWVAADANGHAVVAWLGADKPGNSNDTVAMAGAKWNVYAAETVNGNTTDPAGPTFTQYTASDHVIHTGTVSTGGLNPTGMASRSLADFFQVALDPHHRANIAYADDHAGGSGQPYFTRQKSSSAGQIQSPTEGSCFIPVSKTCSGSGGGDAEGEGDERGDDGHGGHFKMTAKGGCKPSGEMDFNEPDTGQGMKGGVDDVSVSGNTAIITGPCTRLDGTACRYAALVVGNAFPAIGADLFTISWTASDGSLFHTSGILTSGNITVHP